MALPQGFIIEQAQEAEEPTGGLPAGFQMEAEPPPVRQTQPAEQPGFWEGLGQSAISLADVTAGSVIPSVAQMMAYPLSRLNRTPEEAQAATQRIVSAVDKPFGKAFGVTETPQYQQEASRKLVDFIGQNAQKGAEWISNKTGIPASDVESYLGTASLTAPIIAPPVVRGVSNAVKPFQEQLSAGIQLPFEKQLQARREAASLKDYERGPQIEAASEAQRLGLAISPENIKPTVGTKLLSSVAGEGGLQRIAKANETTTRKIVLNELDLPADRQLNGKAAFEESRARLAKPYQQIKALPTMAADTSIISALEELRPGADLIKTDVSAKRINARIDRAIKKLEGGINGNEVLRDIRSLREEASKIYGNKGSPVDALERAQANIGIANTLEQLIENNISDPKLLGKFRDARSKMAKSYAYESATDFNTGKVDVSKLSRLTAKDNALTGDIAALAKVGGNFPEAFSFSPSSGMVNPQLKRTGVAGTLGAMAGYALGDGYGGTIGAALGATIGEAAQNIAARRVASPSYQAGLSLKDMRIPISKQAAASQPPLPNQQAVVPYQPEVLNPSGQGGATPLRIVGYDENQRPIYGPSRAPQGFTMPTQPEFGVRPSTAFAQRTLPNEVPKQVYEAQQNAELAQRYRSDDPSQSMFYGQRRAYQAPEATTGAALPVEQSITTAAQKVASGQLFNMSAAEKVAWNQTRVELQKAVPAWASLSDKTIANKMSDRAALQQAIKTAGEKAEMWGERAKNASTTQTQTTARLSQKNMEDAVSVLKAQLEAQTRRPTNRLDISFGMSPEEMRGNR